MNIFTYNKPQDIPGFLLWSVSRLWQQERRKSLKELKLSHLEFVLMANMLWLSEEKKHITQQIIADWMQIDKMSVSDGVHSLEKKKLIEKEVHPHDKRSSFLTLTPKGEDLALAGVKAVDETNKQFFAPLGDKMEDFMQCLQILIDSQAERNETI